MASVSSPLSISGGWSRGVVLSQRMTPDTPEWWRWVGGSGAWTLGLMAGGLLAMTAILVYMLYLMMPLFLVFVIPFRILRRGSRREKATEKRHQEMMRQMERGRS
jgi:uncharacterized membrane protein